MRHAGYIATLIVSCAFFVATAADAVTFEEGNRAFAEARYGEAADKFEALIREKGYSASLLFNLGNAYLRAGQLGKAIRSYERAQLLAPNDPDIAANLSLARKQAGLFVDQSSWIQEAARFFSLNAWAWIRTGALVVLCALCRCESDVSAATTLSPPLHRRGRAGFVRSSRFRRALGGDT